MTNTSTEVTNVSVKDAHQAYRLCTLKIAKKEAKSSGTHGWASPSLRSLGEKSHQTFPRVLVLVWPVKNWSGFNVYELFYAPVHFYIYANLTFLQFHEAWHKLMEWLEESEKSLDSDLEIANDPDKIKMQLAQHKVSHN